MQSQFPTPCYLGFSSGRERALFHEWFCGKVARLAKLVDGDKRSEKLLRELEVMEEMIKPQTGPGKQNRKGRGKSKDDRIISGASFRLWKRCKRMFKFVSTFVNVKDGTDDEHTSRKKHQWWMAGNVIDEIDRSIQQMHPYYSYGNSTLFTTKDGKVRLTAVEPRGQSVMEMLSAYLKKCGCPLRYALETPVVSDKYDGCVVYIGFYLLACKCEKLAEARERRVGRPGEPSGSRGHSSRSCKGKTLSTKAASKEIALEGIEASEKIFKQGRTILKKYIKDLSKYQDSGHDRSNPRKRAHLTESLIKMAIMKQGYNEYKSLIEAAMGQMVNCEQETDKEKQASAESTRRAWASSSRGSSMGAVAPKERTRHKLWALEERKKVFKNNRDMAVMGEPHASGKARCLGYTIVRFKLPDKRDIKLKVKRMSSFYKIAHSISSYLNVTPNQVVFYLQGERLLPVETLLSINHNPSFPIKCDVVQKTKVYPGMRPRKLQVYMLNEVTNYYEIVQTVDMATIRDIAKAIAAKFQAESWKHVRIFYERRELPYHMTLRRAEVDDENVLDVIVSGSE